MNWYTKCFQNYATFEGRARRKEYWMFALFNFIIAFAWGFVEGLLGIGGFISGLYGLVALLPGISVSVRRMHDIGKSGWWLWIGLIPLVGAIVLLVFACTEGTRGPHMYGDDPKAGEAAA